MLTVSVDPVVVESQLLAGELACPGCGGPLGPWSWAVPRPLGRGKAAQMVRPRRARCRSCRATHVLLPASMLLRRADGVMVIGRAIGLAALGRACRAISRVLGVPRSTVRGWLGRVAVRAERLRVHFTMWLARLTGGALLAPAGSVLADAVAAIGAAGKAAGDHLKVGVWLFASLATGGRLLCNTSAPFPAPWRG